MDVGDKSMEKSAEEKHINQHRREEDSGPTIFLFLKGHLNLI